MADGREPVSPSSFRRAGRLSCFKPYVAFSILVRSPASITPACLCVGLVARLFGVFIGGRFGFFSRRSCSSASARAAITSFPIFSRA